MSLRNYIVKSIKPEITYDWLLHKHYAHRIPQIQYAFGLYENSTLLGCLTFGLPPMSGNISFICGEKFNSEVIELNRLILEDHDIQNLTSYFVRNTIKQLPKPKIILSYADPNNGHTRYIYQATNFLFTGLGGMTKEYKFQGKQYSSRHIKDYWFLNASLPYSPNLSIDDNFKNVGGEVIELEMKNRYVYFHGSKKQVKEYFKHFKLKSLPYPKGSNRRYDTSYKPIQQPELFLCG